LNVSRSKLLHELHEILSFMNEVSISSCVNSGWRSARRSSFAKTLHILIVPIEAAIMSSCFMSLRRLR